MKKNIVIGKFRSGDSAALAVKKLNGQGFDMVYLYQLSEAPVEGVNPMKNPYSGELPLFARGIPGSDIAVEGHSGEGLYNREDAVKIVGHDGPDPAFAVVVDVTGHKNGHLAKDILNKNGADTSRHEIEA